jgi:hypothetical protein
MPRIETNDFAIANLESLSSRYRLYRIKGLNRDHSEYYLNRQHIIRKLGFSLRKPVTIIDRGGIPHLVVRDDAEEIASPMSLVRAPVFFEAIGDSFKVDYTVRSPENDEICVRFLQFMLQEPLYSDPTLWQPRAGAAFFEKTFVHSTDTISHHVGFAVRVVLAPDSGLALRVHVASKYVGRRPLPMCISRDQFEQWRGRHFVYHFGHQWYEIRAAGLSDLNVMQYPIPIEGGWQPLLEYVVQKSRKPIPPELAGVSCNASVINYLDNQNSERGAPAALCYQVYGAHDRGMEQLQRKSLIPPYARRSLTLDFVKNYLTRLWFGKVKLHVNTKPIEIPAQMFSVPDFKFGNGTVLSIRGTAGAQHVSLDKLGVTRAALLRDPTAGFYHTEPLDRQYLILPQSVFESYGSRFVEDLSAAVDELYPQEHDYKPEIVTYNDRVKKTFAHQGNAILDAVSVKCKNPGYAVVMIHRTSERTVRSEDQLAAMVIRKLRDLNITAAAIHSAVGQDSYVLGRGISGQPAYFPRQDARRKLIGYMRNVALNKVLLTNQRWPFVLATPLNADITIGIDVKHHTAGLIVVGRSGEKLRSFCRTSRQKEKLRADQMESYLIEIITDEKTSRTDLARVIVLHRDGRMFSSEIEGARKAIERLKKMGVIALDATLTILEIAKSPQAPARFFEISEKDGIEIEDNPQIGMYRIVGKSEGYLCTTGRAFPRAGTVEPLHVKLIEGPLPIEKCLEDVYSLSALALTKPDDCTRYPITMKLNDRFLGEEATEYDADNLEFDGDMNEDDKIEDDEQKVAKEVKR